MARDLTIQDAHAIMNLLVKQATGQSNISVVDTSTFVSAGEKVLSTGMENVFNSLNIVLGRTLVASRPYNAKLNMMNEMNTGLYTARLRKISFYSKFSKPSGMFNTNLYTNLKDGYTAGQNIDGEGTAHSTKSQWEQNQPIPLELNFGGSATWQNCITLYETQVQEAFRDEGSFNAFVSGYLTEHANDIESQREAYNRMVLLNRIAMTYDMSTDMEGSVINLTKEFNDKFGTSHTSEELRTTYLEDFLKFFVSFFKITSKRMTERTNKYHWSVKKTIDSEDYEILRHTPYNKQRVYLFEDLFTEAESQVMSGIFNPQYLDIKTQYEGVSYWQSVEDRASINVTPAITDTATGLQKAGDNVTLDYVVGMICDTDSMMTNFRLDRTYTTPIEARKGYRNTWQTFLKNAIVDPTENCIIFIMKD